MKIYSFPTFNLTKVLLTAEEVGEAYELHLLDHTNAEHKSAAHIARHPLGKVPAIEIDGKHYFESNAICRFLAERHNNALYGESPENRAVINQWADMATMHVGRWLTVMFYENQIKPVFFKGETSKLAVDEALSFLSQQLPLIENQLNKHAYLAGNQYTLADIIAFSYFDIAELSGVDLSPYPKMNAWVNTIKQRPAFTKAMAHLDGGEMFPSLTSS